MDLALVRSSKGPDGIFSSIMYSAEGNPMLPRSLCVSVEHAYLTANGYEPKLPNGAYDCVRGMHRLHGMTEDFETFEVTGVPGHSGILFHWGNWNENSDGCICTGDAFAQGIREGAHPQEMVTNSRAAFARFLKLQEGVERFVLRVY